MIGVIFLLENLLELTDFPRLTNVCLVDCKASPSLFFTAEQRVD